jgi:hypothetical protein
MHCGNAEPDLEEVLDDPIVHMLLARDGVSRGDIRELVAEARRHLRRQCPAPACAQPSDDRAQDSSIASTRLG